MLYLRDVSSVPFSLSSGGEAMERNILIIEDDKNIADLIGLHVRDQGWVDENAMVPRCWILAKNRLD
jgi:hypothetical protein